MLGPAGPLRAGGGGEAEFAPRNGPGAAQRGAGSGRLLRAGDPGGLSVLPSRGAAGSARSSGGELPAPSVRSWRRGAGKAQRVRRVIYRHGIDRLLSRPGIGDSHR